MSEQLRGCISRGDFRRLCQRHSLCLFAGEYFGKQLLKIADSEI